ncbi:hypothetical protein H1S01_06410 [Heliobacterium chlorum]|uniref:Uncharacterized protein n=1 Tax=Heliobacterium chlorum TaxID=2698 RepID=A0ABR7T021_HELCL|nr:hypothetical protein [Heliobacterium chlorum]MBC9784142.1 hypothetical protein [Heliobacterium chlorum]
MKPGILMAEVIGLPKEPERSAADKEVVLGNQEKRIKDAHDAAGIATETFGVNPEESRQVDI